MANRPESKVTNKEADRGVEAAINVMPSIAKPIKPPSTSPMETHISTRPTFVLDPLPSETWDNYQK